MKLIPIALSLALGSISSTFAASVTFTGIFGEFYYGEAIGGPPPSPASSVQFSMTLNFNSDVTPTVHAPEGTLFPLTGSNLMERMGDSMYGYSASSFTSVSFTTSYIPEVGSAFSYEWTTAQLAAFEEQSLMDQQVFILTNADLATGFPTEISFRILFQTSDSRYLTLDAGQIFQTNVPPTGENYIPGDVALERSFNPAQRNFYLAYYPSSGLDAASLTGAGGAWVAVPEPSVMTFSLISLGLVLRRKRRA